MITTIQVTKEMKLNELITFLMENDVKDQKYNRKGSRTWEHVKINPHGVISVLNVSQSATFDVEVIMGVEEDTEFESLTYVLDAGIFTSAKLNSIQRVRNNIKGVRQILAMVNGKLYPIWEGETNE